MMFNTRDRFNFCTWCGRLVLNRGVSFTFVVWGRRTGAKTGLQTHRGPNGGCHWWVGHQCVCHCLSLVAQAAPLLKPMKTWVFNPMSSWV